MDKSASLLEVDKSGGERGSVDFITMPAAIKPMALSEERLLFILDKIDKADWAVDDKYAKQPTLGRLLWLLGSTELTFEIGDNCGVVLVGSVQIGRSAEVSLLIWDRSFFRQIDTAKDVLRWLMWSLHLSRLTAYLTPTNILALRFDKKIGFVEEGRLRKSIWRNGVLMDVIILGLLREEVGLACLSEPAQERASQQDQSQDIFQD